MQEELIVFDSSVRGHRQSYVNAIAEEMNGSGIIGWNFGNIRKIFLADKLIISTADTGYCDVIMTVILVTIRSIILKKTICISHDSVRIFRRLNKYKSLFRLVLLKSLKHWPNCGVVSVVPHWVEPRLKSLTNGWIYDVQFWDLRGQRLSENSPAREVLRDIRTRAGQRSIVMAIGRQSMRKGTAYMMELYQTFPRLREKYLFVICGEFGTDLASLKSEFGSIGGYCVDEALSNDEILACYDEADLVWTCYLPEHNQSSGIFGRALQFGRPVVVRQGSYLETLMAKLGSGVSVPLDDKNEAANVLDHFDIDKNRSIDENVWRELREQSVMNINKCFNPST